MSDINLQRRNFLKTAAGAAMVTVAPGMLLFDVAHGNPQSVGKVRWGMLIDTAACKPGCNDCVTACNKENGLSGGTAATDSQWIRKIEIKDISSGREVSRPVAPSAGPFAGHRAPPPVPAGLFRSIRAVPLRPGPRIVFQRRNHPARDNWARSS